MDILIKCLEPILNFLYANYSNAEISLINSEIKKIMPFDYNYLNHVISKPIRYEEIQSILSSFNEKESKRKNNGVYYTPNDVVKFIISNSIKSLYGNLKPTNLHVQDLNGIPYKKLCYRDSIFDPTCGAGEFLIVSLGIKLDMADLHQEKVTNADVKKILKTIYGNDIDFDSTTISKLRILIYILHRYGVETINGVVDVLNERFFNVDFINLSDDFEKKFDNISDSIIFMPIDNNVYLSIPGGLLGGTNSVGSIRYTLYGTEYSLLHELDKNKNYI